MAAHGIRLFPYDMVKGIIKVQDLFLFLFLLRRIILGKDCQNHCDGEKDSKISKITNKHVTFHWFNVT